MLTFWEGPELVAAHPARPEIDAPAVDHFAPWPHCQCGIHVVHSVTDRRWLARTGAVLAAVVCEGVIIPHGVEGLRVERARIVAVAPASGVVLDFGRAPGAPPKEVSIDAIAQRYGVAAVRRDFLLPYALETTGGVLYTPNP
jgi:hypothetical protein